MLAYSREHVSTFLKRMSFTNFKFFLKLLCTLFLFSYVLTGTSKGFQETFGSTCHGAVSTHTYTHLYSSIHIIISIMVLIEGISSQL